MPRRDSSSILRKGSNRDKAPLQQSTSYFLHTKRKDEMIDTEIVITARHLIWSHVATQQHKRETRNMPDCARNAMHLEI